MSSNRILAFESPLTPGTTTDLWTSPCRNQKFGEKFRMCSRELKVFKKERS